MSARTLDDTRRGVLDTMERAERGVRLAMLGAAVAEAALFAVAFLMVDWHARLERLMFVFAVLSYTIIVLGLFALAAHVTRCAARVVAAIEPDPGHRADRAG